MGFGFRSAFRRPPTSWNGACLAGGDNAVDPGENLPRSCGTKRKSLATPAAKAGATPKSPL